MTKDEALREAIDTLKSTKHGNCDFAWIDETLKKCTEALAQPEQKWRPQDHYADGWRDGFNSLKPTTPPLPVPLEYWNAVEGWVKIDEVREHFDSVGCGTIYKNGGEGRVPLYTASPLPVQEPVAWDKPSASFDEWWDSDRRRDNANPFATDSFAYWAWEGWQAAHDQTTS